MFVLLKRVFVAVLSSAILTAVTGAVGLELDVVRSSSTTHVVADGGHGWIGSPQP